MHASASEGTGQQWQRQRQRTFLLITNRGAECRGAVVVGAKGGVAARDAWNWAHHLGEMRCPPNRGAVQRLYSTQPSPAQPSTALQAARVIREGKPLDGGREAETQQ